MIINDWNGVPEYRFCKGFSDTVSFAPSKRTERVGVSGLPVWRFVPLTFWVKALRLKLGRLTPLLGVSVHREKIDDKLRTLFQLQAVAHGDVSIHGGMSRV